MRLKELTVRPNTPLSQWPVFYKDGLPFIYDDDELFYNEEGEHLGIHPGHLELAIYLRDVLLMIGPELMANVTMEVTFRAYIDLDEAAAADAATERRRYIDITPDISVIKEVSVPYKATYFVGEDGPAPEVVFEIGSKSTYREDLGRKLQLYAQVVKAKEYLAYDPYKGRSRLWKGSRLKAWRLGDNGYQEISRDGRGWVWSEVLRRWIVESEQLLRLFNPDGTPVLTRAEQAEARVEEIETIAQQERTRSVRAELRASEAEAQAQADKRRAVEAEGQAQVEKQRVAALEARLRELEARLKEPEKPE